MQAINAKTRVPPDHRTAMKPMRQLHRRISRRTGSPWVERQRSGERRRGYGPGEDGTNEGPKPRSSTLLLQIILPREHISALRLP